MWDLYKFVSLLIFISLLYLLALLFPADEKKSHDYTQLKKVQTIFILLMYLVLDVQFRFKILHVMQLVVFFYDISG